MTSNFHLSICWRERERESPGSNEKLIFPLPRANLRVCVAICTAGDGRQGSAGTGRVLDSSVRVSKSGVRPGWGCYLHGPCVSFALLPEGGSERERESELRPKLYSSRRSRFPLTSRTRTNGEGVKAENKEK